VTASNNALAGVIVVVVEVIGLKEIVAEETTEWVVMMIEEAAST
jgi:hypothetical protein